MNLVAYTRRSTDRQAASPHTQEREIRDYCEARSHELVRVYHEVPISGKSEEERRTALPQLLSEVRDKRRDFDGVVVWKLDRLCRNPAEHHRILGILDKHGCAIVSIMDPVSKRDTAADRLISGVFADVAAYEREITGERIYAHHLTQALTGKWPGGNLPLGLEYDPDNQTIVAGDRAPDAIRLFEIFFQANGNATQAAWRLNAEAIPSPHGKLWTPKAVYRLVRSPFYRGKLFWDGREIVPPEPLPEIVPCTLVEQVDNLLQVTRQLAPRQRSGEPYSGLLHCSLCGSLLVATSGRAGGVSYGLVGLQRRQMLEHPLPTSRLPPLH